MNMDRSHSPKKYMVTESPRMDSNLMGYKEPISEQPEVEAFSHSTSSRRVIECIDKQASTEHPDLSERRQIQRERIALEQAKNMLELEREELDKKKEEIRLLMDEIDVKQGKSPLRKPKIEEKKWSPPMGRPFARPPA
jgi:hypothetical protein